MRRLCKVLTQRQRALIFHGRGVRGNSACYKLNRGLISSAITGLTTSKAMH
jgi:hypothetical protein